MFLPSNWVLLQSLLLIITILSWTIQGNDTVGSEVHQYNHDEQAHQLSNSNVEIDDEPLAHLLDKRYANKVIRGDTRLWAIPYRFGKRGAMPYRFGRRAAMPMRFGKKSSLI